MTSVDAPFPPGQAPTAPTPEAEQAPVHHATPMRDVDPNHDPDAWAAAQMAEIMAGVRLVRVDLGPESTPIAFDGWPVADSAMPEAQAAEVTR